jgi:hypothetical protein
VPLCTSDTTIGALNLMNTRLPVLSVGELRLAGLLVDAATASFLHHQRMRSQGEIAEQLR